MEVANFINSNKIGIVCDDNVESLYEALINIDLKTISEYTKNQKLLKENNTWNKRVEEISKLGKR